MSLAGDRAAIAAALTAAGLDVRGHTYRPDTPRPGDAWPLLDALDREDGMLAATWRILLVLPGEERGAIEWMDARAAELVDALALVGYVERIKPAMINGTLFGAEVTMRSE